MTRSQRQIAYQHLRSQLATGAVKQGQRISENRYANDLGMSRIPVREAVSQLTSEGLIRQIPGTGAFVPQLTSEEVCELFDLREMLECYAVERVATSGLEEAATKAILSRIGDMRSIARAIRESQPKALDHPLLGEWALADAMFHRALLRASGCMRMTKVVADANVLTRSITCMFRCDEEPLVMFVARVLREHWEIYRSLKNRQPILAVTLMAEHVQQSKQAALATCEKANSWPELLEFEESAF